MRQKTIAKRVEVTGIGLHKGVPVKMTLDPMPPNSGIIFHRSDKNVQIKLSPQNVTNTTLATVLSNGDVKISTIEHLLSAIYAYGIDNIKISVDNEEIPIMDGSSVGYCILIDEAGELVQDEMRKVMIIRRAVEVRDGDKFVRIEPSDQMIFDFEIDFEHPAIRKQHYKFTFSKQAYKDEIARARTFGFLKDVNKLRSQGLGLGGNLNNCIVLDETRVLNTGSLRFKEEFVRHKILDAIGDMAVLGIPLLGSYISFAGSHKLNAMLTEKILEVGAFEIVKEQDISPDLSLSLSKERV
ncbi:MAG: UDP-3-O-acyl-N-acetylglucosamine deacetylase [Helicobacter sp.]|nr:UDP-3-O-acyl-N-acetylglucosamine deacetylase [Helicobacter sp.]